MFGLSGFWFEKRIAMFELSTLDKFETSDFW